MDKMTWWDYVQTVAGGAEQREIADRAGFDKSALTRWKNGSNADPLFVVKFARAFGRPVTEALAASGLITAEESGITVVTAGVAEALREATNDELLAELSSRLNVGASSDADGLDNVTMLTRAEVEADLELRPAANRRVRKADREPYAE